MMPARSSPTTGASTLQDVWSMMASIRKALRLKAMAEDVIVYRKYIP
jgi:hypothetical protein